MRQRLVGGRDRVLASLSVRGRVARLVFAASPPLAMAALVFVLVEGLLPTLVLVAIGWATGRIPAAVAHGLGSPAGHALLEALAVGAGAYALSLMRSPLEDLLCARSSAVMTSDLQRRLARAVSEPTGIEHLEDPDVLDQLSSATGELSSARPGDAPMALAGVLGDRLAGLLACRYWPVSDGGSGSCSSWVGAPSARPCAACWPTGRLWCAGRPRLRHSWYYLGCAWRPEFAKEMRVFGLGQWVLDRYREKWLEGWPRRGKKPAISNAGPWLSAPWCSPCTWSAWASSALAAYRGEMGLRTVAVMLPMFMLAAQVGGVSPAT